MAATKNKKNGKCGHLSLVLLKTIFRNNATVLLVDISNMLVAELFLFSERETIVIYIITVEIY